MLVRQGELLPEQNSAYRSASGCGHSSLSVVRRPAKIASLTVLAAVITLASSHDALPLFRSPLPVIPAPDLGGHSVEVLESTVTKMVNVDETGWRRSELVLAIPRVDVADR